MQERRDSRSGASVRLQRITNATLVLRAAPDGMIHGLPRLARMANGSINWTTIPSSLSRILNSSTYQAAPFSFTSRNREDIFIKLMEAFNRHWQTNKGTGRMY